MSNANSLGGIGSAGRLKPDINIVISSSYMRFMPERPCPGGPDVAAAAPLSAHASGLNSRSVAAAADPNRCPGPPSRRPAPVPRPRATGVTLRGGPGSPLHSGRNDDGRASSASRAVTSASQWPLASGIEAMRDPGGGQFLLGPVLRQPPAQGREIHEIERLVLVEAGIDHPLLAGFRVPVQL